MPTETTRQLPRVPVAGRWAPGLPPNAVPSEEEAVRVLRALPPFSAVAAHLLKAVAQEDVAFRKVADFIKTDAALSADMLRIANSALFGPRYPVTGVLHAAAMLGVDRVRSLVTTVALKDFVGKARGAPAVSRCWRHNLACAILCEEIARKGRMDRDFAYTAGLLHDIGRVAMMRAWMQRYAAMLDAAAPDSAAILQMEFEGFGIRHTRAGYLLVKGWRLPSAFAEIADRHHSTEPEIPNDVAALVHFGCSLADRLGFGVAGQPASEDAEPRAGPPAAFEEFVPGNLEDFGSRLAEHVNELECCLAG